MAGEFTSGNDNVFLEFDCQNIVLLDPNRVQNADGTVSDRKIHHEELVMYANLEAFVYPRTKLAVGAPETDVITNVQLASTNFLRPEGRSTLTNNYLDVFFGENKTNQGTTIPNQASIQQPNRTDEFFIAQTTDRNISSGLLGIESIKVSNDRSNTPVVDMVLIDVGGRALFEKGDESEYASFFNLPYPVFYLTLKGYYGKAIKYQLMLTDFSAAFEGNTGNYRITLKFYSYKYTILAETQMGALFSVPFMYSNQYRVTTSGVENPAVQAARASLGSTTVGTIDVNTTKGYETIKNVYAKYKSLGLISPNLPELTLPALRARLQTLEKQILENFGQVDFSPLSDVQTYVKLLTEFYNDIFSDSSTSWFGVHLDRAKPFVLKSTKDKTQNGILTYVFNDNILGNSQAEIDAYVKLKQLVVGFKEQLNKNKTLGTQGSYTIAGVTYTNSKIKKIDNIFVNDPLTSIDNQQQLKPDTFRKSITSSEIDWKQTYILRNKVEPTDLQVELLEKEEGQKYFRTQAFKVSDVELYPTFNFVFQGAGNFEDLINQITNEVNDVKQNIVGLLSAFLERQIEKPEVLGFRPSIRNIMAMIFASIEAFYLLMDDVHTRAWAQRFNDYRKRAIFSVDTQSASSDTKDLVQTERGNTVSDTPVYPWPQYLVNTNSPSGEIFELRYPGDPGEIANTGAYNFFNWPEVEFVEEYIKGLARTTENPPVPTSLTNESRSIRRLSVNGVEFPMTNLPYSDYQNVRFLYEIYERILLPAYYDRLNRPGSNQDSVYKTISDIESLNIQTSLLGTSPSLTKILKNIALTPTNYLAVLRQSSNDGTGPSWQRFIRGYYTSDYLQLLTDQNYAILDETFLNGGALTTKENVESISGLTKYVKSSSSSQTDFLDLYPFVSKEWTKENLASINSTSNYYNTTRSLYVNETDRFITNYQSGLGPETNSPFTSGNFLNSKTGDVPTGITVGNEFYDNRQFQQNYFVTEGAVNYVNKTGRLTPFQTTSMLNTPFFLNALMDGVDRERAGVDAYPYKDAAYLFLNSLPLATLREKYKNYTPTVTEELDYIFATLTKFGGVHRLPYTWILKYGSIWHRYKTYIQTGTDILTSAWKNVDLANLYDPITNDLSKTYSFTNQLGQPVKIQAQANVIVPDPQQNLDVNFVNIGFYPKVINNMYYLFTGQDLFTTYSDTEIQNAITEGLNVGVVNSQNYNVGFDPLDANRTMNYTTWYATFDTKDNPKFGGGIPNKTITIPSFAYQTNQVISECFVQSGTTGGSPRYVLKQEVFNNAAVFNGAVRTFWSAPNYGYFELQSITKPPVDTYFKKILPNNNGYDPFQLGTGYTSIEEVFGTFKTEILDSFETEFLNFSRSVGSIPAEELSKDDSTYKNKVFQVLLANLITIDGVDNQNSNYLFGTAGTQVKGVVGNQQFQIEETLNTFLNYNVAFKYGNPGNYDRRIFGSFTTRPDNRIFDPIQYNPYVVNTLPSSTGFPTLAQSNLLNPTAWESMYLNVGFATEPGLRYSDTGSYFTDFFIDLNVEFTENNVRLFAPLIKIYGAQKYLAEGNYSGTTFTNDLNNFFASGDEFISKTLTQLFFSLQKELPNVEVENVRSVPSSLNGNQTKLDLYEGFKAFNDKWIAGVNFEQRTLFQDVLFLDRANRDIGDLALVDVFKLADFFSGTTVTNVRAIDFIGKIIMDNKFYMMPMPAYVNFWGLGDVQNGQRPRTESSQDLANSLFGTFLDVDYRDSRPKLVCYFVGKPSEQLSLKNNKLNGFKNDSFVFDCGGDQPLTDKLEGKVNWANSNRVVAFNVDFGTRNQGVFYSIQLDQKLAAATSEGNRVITDAVLQTGGRRAITQSVGLFNYYKTRSYECRVESLGNAMIQPTMYFNLQHVPMFYGPYMIQSVEHSIESGSFRTFFTGVRIPVYSIPLITEQIVNLNATLLGELIQKIQRLKETETPVVSTNVISIGNTISPNQNYKPAFGITCQNDMNVTYRNYRTFTPLEQPTQQSISFKDLATLIKSRVSNNVVKMAVFFTAYINGHDEKNIYTFDFDLGGTPLGGTPFSGSTAVGYGDRSKFFRKEFSCKTNSVGVTAPFAVFDNYQKSVDFISNYYLNPSSGGPASLLFSDPNRFRWDNKTNAALSLSRLWIEYWPTKKFATAEQYESYVKANKTSAEKVYKIATEAIEKSISLGLISF